MVSQFNESDEAILRHVLRYRLTTLHILSCSEILALSEAEIADRLERLVSLGLLASAPLITGYDEPKYFHLTEAAAISLGQDIAVAKPLKVDARAEWFAVASFCCCGDTVRELFTKDEFQTQFKHLWFVGQPVRYYLEPGDDGVVRLAFIKVDTGGPGQWDRLIDSCQRFLHQRTTPDKVAKAFRDKVSAYASMVEQGRFQISILTALPEKQRAIALELERRRLKEPPAPPIKAYVVPGLLEVLHPRPR